MRCRHGCSRAEITIHDHVMMVIMMIVTMTMMMTIAPHAVLSWAGAAGRGRGYWRGGGKWCLACCVFGGAHRQARTQQAWRRVSSALMVWVCDRHAAGEGRAGK